MDIGLLVFPQVEELDVIGPWEMFSLWKQHDGGPSSCLTVAERLEPVVCANGLSINPHVSFEACPALDVLLVPGGQGTRVEVFNPCLLEFVAEQARSCQAVLSVCTGAFLLQAAGLLAGKRATTHWASLDRLRAFGDVEVVEERFTRDGMIWCSAGVSAGIDLTLRFIAEVAGEEVAGKVQFDAEYFPSGVVYGHAHSDDQAPDYLRQTD
ncbi:MAG: DJ-1/PfpI family protein [Cyanobium sp.]|jgi:transcriptional regulator GlxA family with amidase domain|uniref:DJ-1/PfpI family protein n=1 Tax=Synechococcus sp. CS-1333 TaxID=2848638 RepID=UPI000DBC13E1|nr:DJ-1/PfpI family protein [Synechococcus sp. CS-1333]MCT0211087.1 DJ-1/PfpI family protein [Synechococcus sp. CS-1333]PZV20853.1 MAG: DJ-1/PfpI family protein [Cyanobium sp.]